MVVCWVGRDGDSGSGLISICVGIGCSVGGTTSGCDFGEGSDDSSWNENRSWAGVDDMSLAESYMGSFSSPAKFSLAYLVGCCVWSWGVGLGLQGCGGVVVWV